MKIAVIPARGGSQRIPRKNLRHFCGRPIIAYSIEAALSANCFDEVMVSTDDEEIAQVATECGAVVPFRRSSRNSSDVATTIDVLLEVLEEYRLRGKDWDLFCCLYPTAPFTTPDLLNSGLQLLLDSTGTTNSVFPVVQYSHPIQRALRIREGFVSMYEPKNILVRTQDLEPSYHDAGQFYWAETKAFLKTKKIIGSGAMGLVVPESKVQDIDNEADWLIAEMKFRLIREAEEQR